MHYGVNEGRGYFTLFASDYLFCGDSKFVHLYQNVLDAMIGIIQYGK